MENHKKIIKNKIPRENVDGISTSESEKHNKKAVKQ